MPSNEAAQNPQTSSQNPANSHKGTSKTRWPIAGDWLAPFIVWGLMIVLGLAVVSLLLGDK